MHLSDRGGRERALVKARKKLLERAAVSLLDQGPRMGARKRRHPVLKLCQLFGDIVG